MARTSKAVANARRLWPYVLIAWERWQALPQKEKERYKRQARQYADQAKALLDEQRRKQR